MQTLRFNQDLTLPDKLNGTSQAYGYNALACKSQVVQDRSCSLAGRTIGVGAVREESAIITYHWRRRRDWFPARLKYLIRREALGLIANALLGSRKPFK